MDDKLIHQKLRDLIDALQESESRNDIALASVLCSALACHINGQSELLMRSTSEVSRAWLKAIEAMKN